MRHGDFVLCDDSPESNQKSNRKDQKVGNMGPNRKYSSPKSKESAPKNVSREDIEKKLNEIDEIVEEVTSSAADVAKIAIGVAVVVVVAFAFFSGRRRALRPRTLVTFTKTR